MLQPWPQARAQFHSRYWLAALKAAEWAPSKLAPITGLSRTNNYRHLARVIKAGRGPALSIELKPWIEALHEFKKSYWTEALAAVPQTARLAAATRVGRVSIYRYLKLLGIPRERLGNYGRLGNWRGLAD